MSTSTAPAELYRRGLRLLIEKDIPGWVALRDEDGALEFPFAPHFTGTTGTR